MELSVILDHQQPRLGNDYLSVVATSKEWDFGGYSDTTRDPVYGYGILAPYCFDAAWNTSNSGNYAKYSLSSFSTSGTWNESEMVNVTAGKWLSCEGAGTLSVNFAAKNIGCVIGLFNYEAQNQSKTPDPAVRIKWSTSIQIDVFADGTVDVYKDSVIIESGSISAWKTDQKAKQKGTFFQFLVMPFNHNQILIWSGNGGSFAVELTDIPQSEASPTVLPSGTFSCEVFGATKSKLQVSQLKFHTSGTIESEKMNFIEPPVSGDTLQSFDNPAWIGTENYQILGYQAYVGTQDIVASLVDWSGAAFVKNGVNTEVKLKATMTSSSNLYTPTLVCMQMGYQATTTATSNSPIDIMCHVKSLSLDIPQDPDGVSLQMTCISTITDDVPTIMQLSRPIKVLDGEVVIFDGIVTDVSKDLRRGETVYTITARDSFELLDKYIFRERVPAAGGLFTGTIGFLADKGIVYTPTPDISTSTYKLPFVSGEELEDMGKVFGIGDTASNSLREVFESFAPDWVYGFVPSASGILFQALQPSDLPSASDKTLYETTADAVIGGAATDVFWAVNQQRIPPEANQVRVSGWDPRKKRVVMAYKEDAASFDATTIPASRPDNWVGYKLCYGILEPAIVTIDDAVYACGLMFDILSPAREMAEWESLPLYRTSDSLPIWKNDIVTLDGYGDYRIRAMRYDWATDTFATVTYTGQRIL